MENQLSWEQLDSWLQRFINKPLYVVHSITEIPNDWDSNLVFVFHNYFIISKVRYVSSEGRSLHIRGWQENENLNLFKNKNAVIRELQGFVTITSFDSINKTEISFSSQPF
ncbi:hypothetical protein LJR153_007282 [Paenibacillus sp. LjRoot153]|uniref:hypothetical protein n=1 Tax=Paenibacillus sp. LjRoot153 TaxID=3342270 RepID=UPI003ECE22A1